MYFTHFLHIVFGSLVLVTTCLPSALAEKADKDKPMNIEADTLNFDNLQQISVFKGNVVLTKGTLVVRAAEAEVRQDAEGFQYFTAKAAASPAGQVATYKQKREGVDETLQGEGQTIVYDGKTDILRFEKNAVVRRFAGAKLLDESSGSVITYNNLQDTFNVVGGKDSAGVGNPNGRVRMVLSPKDAGKEVGKAAGKDTKPAAHGAGSVVPTAPQLRPTRELK